VKEKRFWVASFLVAWAAALQVSSFLLSVCLQFNPPSASDSKSKNFHFLVHQGHMMWMQRQETFKHKFGADASDASSSSDSSSN
jgi:hypothetical protein